MGTSWASVITDYAMLIIDDLRMQEELAENPALFFRKMSFYMKNAIPRFNRPPEIADWLTYTEPTFDAYSYTAATEITETTVIESGKTGFALMSAGIAEKDVYGNPTYAPTGIAAYDPETGDITLTASAESPIAAGTVLSFDFYTDGVFTNDLTDQQKRIVGLCIAYVWELRFTGNWLNRLPRAKDRSFDAGNVANQTRTNTERMTAVKRALDDALAAYGQNNAYMQDYKGATALY